MSNYHNKRANCNQTNCYQSPLQAPKIIWIFCLSATPGRISEDTIKNIEAAAEYLRTTPAHLVKAIILCGDLRLLDSNGKPKKKSVPQMMLEYIKERHYEEYDKFADKFILENHSLTSRENIPMGLTKLYNQVKFENFEEHIICTEYWHAKVCKFLLEYYFKKSYRYGMTGKTVTIKPSGQTKLGFFGRLRRYFQQIEVWLFPTGKYSLLYWYILKGRQKYRPKQF